MSLALPLIIGVIAFFGIIVLIDFKLNINDDATTVGQFKKFQDSFKGDK